MKGQLLPSELGVRATMRLPKHKEGTGVDFSQVRSGNGAAQSIALKWRLTCMKEQNVAHQFLSSKESRFDNGLDLPELLYGYSI